MRTSLTVNEVVDRLNEFNKTDSSALKKIFDNRVPCNKDMGDHPTIQCGQRKKRYTVGMLGLLNGLFGIYPDYPKKGYGPITMSVGDSGEIVGFERTRE